MTEGQKIARDLFSPTPGWLIRPLFAYCSTCPDWPGTSCEHEAARHFDSREHVEAHAVRERAYRRGDEAPEMERLVRALAQDGRHDYSRALGDCPTCVAQAIRDRIDGVRT